MLLKVTKIGLQTCYFPNVQVPQILFTLCFGKFLVAQITQLCLLYFNFQAMCYYFPVFVMQFLYYKLTLALIRLAEIKNQIQKNMT